MESSLLFQASEKIKIGPKALGLIGDDVNFSEGSSNQSVGLFLGGELTYKLNSDYKLDLDIQQRIDNLNRTNILSNFGLKINF